MNQIKKIITSVVLAMTLTFASPLSVKADTGEGGPQETNKAKTPTLADAVRVAQIVISIVTSVT